MIFSPRYLRVQKACELVVTRYSVLIREGVLRVKQDSRSCEHHELSAYGGMCSARVLIYIAPFDPIPFPLLEIPQIRGILP